MAKSTQHCMLSETGGKRTNCANRPEGKKKSHWVSILRQWWGQMSAEQEMQGLQVHRSDTPIYSHIEKRPHVDSYHKISVIWAGLGPLADLLEEREQWCRFTPGNKTGRRKLPGSKLLRSGESSCIKAAASECVSSLKLWRVFSLPLSFSCRYFRSGNTATPKVWSHRWPVTSVTSHWLRGWISWLSLLVLAGCNSNSMWKLCMFHWKCCYLQRAIECSAKPQLLRCTYVFIHPCLLQRCFTLTGEESWWGTRWWPMNWQPVSENVCLSVL